MIVDFHVHLFAPGHLPARWFDALARHLGAQRPGVSERKQLAARLEDRILDPDGRFMMKDLDTAGIDTVVSHPLDYGLALGEPIASMDEIVEHNAALQQRYPGRYVSFTGVDPRRPGAVDFVRRTIRDLGLKGLNLYPPAGFDPASPESLAVCRVAMEENVPVMFHTGGVNFPMRARYGNPALLGDVQAELPELKFIIGHAGFPYQWTDAITVARRNPNAYLEISQWYKSASRDYAKFVEVVTEMRNEMGTGRILFGSDHLSGPGVGGGKSELSAWLDCIRRLPQENPQFTAEDVQKILGTNAQGLLNADGGLHA